MRLSARGNASTRAGGCVYPRQWECVQPRRGNASIRAGAVRLPAQGGMRLSAPGECVHPRQGPRPPRSRTPPCALTPFRFESKHSTLAR
jgi:hypothetical protein